MLNKIARIVWFAGVALVFAAGYPQQHALAQDDPGFGPITVEGELEVIIVDDFQRGRSETFYLIREERSGRSFRLRLEQAPGNLRTGDRVRIRGQARGGRIEVEELQQAEQEAGALEEDEAAEPLLAAAADERRAVVMIVRLGSRVGRAVRGSVACVLGPR